MFKVFTRLTLVQQENLSAVSFLVTLMMEMELVSETLDFIIYLKQLPAR